MTIDVMVFVSFVSNGGFHNTIPPFFLCDKKFCSASVCLLISFHDARVCAFSFIPLRRAIYLRVQTTKYLPPEAWSKKEGRAPLWSIRLGFMILASRG